MTRDLRVIVPSRGRPHAVAAMHDAWAESGTERAELHWGLDDDDPSLDDYLTALNGTDVDFPVSWTVGPRLRMIGTLNDLAVQDADDGWPLIGFMGDDHRPRTPRALDTVADALSDAPRIVYGNDQLQGEAMATAVFLTADIVTALGYMAPPELTHLCADVVWCDWGRAIGRLTYLPDVVIQHQHPANGTGLWDDIYASTNTDAVYAADGAAHATYRAKRQDRDIDRLRALL